MHANPECYVKNESRVVICGIIRTLSYVTWNSTSFPLPNGSKNLSVTAATMAQKKLHGAVQHYKLTENSSSTTYLLHITLAGKKYETSSRLKSTPPIGAPKATATPAAHAALRISRLLAVCGQKHD